MIGCCCIYDKLEHPDLSHRKSYQVFISPSCTISFFFFSSPKCRIFYVFLLSFMSLVLAFQGVKVFSLLTLKYGNALLRESSECTLATRPKQRTAGLGDREHRWLGGPLLTKNGTKNVPKCEQP